MTLANRKKLYEHFKSIGRKDENLEKEFGSISKPVEFKSNLPKKKEEKKVR